LRAVQPTICLDHSEFKHFLKQLMPVTSPLTLVARPVKSRQAGESTAALAL